MKSNALLETGVCRKSNRGNYGNTLSVNSLIKAQGAEVRVTFHTGRYQLPEAL